MPPTTEGLKKFLNSWLYGVLQTAKELGNAEVFMRKVQEVGIRRFLEVEGLRFEGLKDPLAVCRRYTEQLDDLGVMDASDVGYAAEGDALRLTIGATCPYRETCDGIHARGEPVHCYRATAFAEMLRIVLDRDYDPAPVVFGLPCRVQLLPMRLEAFRHGH